MMTASGSGDARRSLSWRWWRWRAPAFISAALVWGCSSGAPRPEPVDQAPIPANAPSDVAPPSAAAAEVCAPGTTRSCMLREVTEDGYKYCHEDFELCRPDGLAFYPCGAYVATDSGYRERRPGGG